MSVWHIVGVDPGLVHTGVVYLSIGDRLVTHSHALVQGLDAKATADWINSHPDKPDKVYIEKYDPRLNFNSDERMVKGEVLFKRALPKAEFIRNAGASKVVPIMVMDLLGVWNFKTTSHHQDLRAAARIALFGMMKNPLLNTALADAMRDAIDGDPWQVVDLGGGVVSASIAD